MVGKTEPSAGGRDDPRPSLSRGQVNLLTKSSFNTIRSDPTVSVT